MYDVFSFPAFFSHLLIRPADDLALPARSPDRTFSLPLPTGRAPLPARYANIIRIRACAALHSFAQMSRIEVYILAFHFPLQVLLYPGARRAPVNLSYERRKKGHVTISIHLQYCGFRERNSERVNCMCRVAVWGRSEL